MQKGRALKKTTAEGISPEIGPDWFGLASGLAYPSEPRPIPHRSKTTQRSEAKQKKTNQLELDWEFLGQVLAPLFAASEAKYIFHRLRGADPEEARAQSEPEDQDAWTGELTKELEFLAFWSCFFFSVCRF